MEKKKTNKDVIDAVVGSLNNEDGKLWVFPIIHQIYKELNEKEIFQYNSGVSNKEFLINMEKWIFGDFLKKIKETFAIQEAITPGSSIGLFMSLFMNKKYPVLNADATWPAYETMAQVNEQKYFSYKFLDKKCSFNIVDFSKKVDSILKNNDGINIIINDPCHNPTGYSLGKEEWEKIIKKLNQFKAKKINVVIDTAYIEFSKVKEHFLQNLINLNKNVKVYLTYSCSKTFSLYGLRLGVLFFLSKQKKESLVLSKYVRGVYSNPPTLPISIINKLFSNPKYYDSYISQLEEQRKILQERSEIFINEANKIKLQFCEYLGGFFIFIPCKNSFSAYEKLKKENIFIAPLDTGVRISIGYVSKKEIKGLASKIKGVIG